MKKFIFLILLILVLHACQKINQGEETTYLKSVKVGSKYLYEYEYDDKNRVTKIIHYDDQGKFQEEETRIYNQNDELIERTFRDENGEYIYYSTFTYFLPDSVRRDNYRNPNDTLERYDIYLFDSLATCNFKGRYTYNPSGNNLLYHYTSTNLDNNCSALLTNYTETGHILKKSKFIVNNTNSAYQKVNFPFLNTYNNNSIIEVEITDHNDQIFDNQSYTSIFKYNDLDFPIQETRMYRDGRELNLAYHYIHE